VAKLEKIKADIETLRGTIQLECANLSPLMLSRAERVQVRTQLEGWARDLNQLVYRLNRTATQLFEVPERQAHAQDDEAFGFGD
jgi:hypothetical protein